MTKIAKTEFTWLSRSAEAGFDDGRRNEAETSRADTAEAPSLMQNTIGLLAQASQSPSSSTSQPARTGNPDGLNCNGSSVFFPRKTLPTVSTPHLDSAALLPGLELIRGLACLQVFVSHIFTVLMFHSRANMSPSFWKLAVLDWSYQSVMVFFVLSGYVIALSQQRKQRDFYSFMQSRFRRLEPLYLVALAISFGLEAILYPPPAYNRLLGHLVFIQGSNLAPVFNTNAPLWSLGYEFYFYLIFAFTIGRNQKFLNVGWFILGLGAIAFSLAGFTAPGLFGYFQGILSLSPVWLLGVLLVYRPLYAGTNIIQNFMLFGMLPLASHSLSFLGRTNSPAHSMVMGLLIAPLLCTAAQIQPVRSHSSPFSWVVIFGLYFLLAGSFLADNQGLNHHTETLFALTAPFIFLFVVPFYPLIFGNDARFFTPRVTSFSLGLGKMSYAIYIIHFPILIVLGTIMINPVLLIIADIVLVILIAWLLEYRLLPALGTLFKRRWQSSSDMAVLH